MNRACWNCGCADEHFFATHVFTFPPVPPAELPEESAEAEEPQFQGVLMRCPRMFSCSLHRSSPAQRGYEAVPDAALPAVHRDDRIKT
jgi:hypothetical protein